MSRFGYLRQQLSGCLNLVAELLHVLLCSFVKVCRVAFKVEPLQNELRSKVLLHDCAHLHRQSKAIQKLRPEFALLQVVIRQGQLARE